MSVLSGVTNNHFSVLHLDTEFTFYNHIPTCPRPSASSMQRAEQDPLQLSCNNGSVIGWRLLANLFGCYGREAICAKGRFTVCAPTPSWPPGSRRNQSTQAHRHGLMATHEARRRRNRGRRAAQYGSSCLPAKAMLVDPSTRPLSQTLPYSAVLLRHDRRMSFPTCYPCVVLPLTMGEG